MVLIGKVKKSKFALSLECNASCCTQKTCKLAVLPCNERESYHLHSLRHIFPTRLMCVNLKVK